MQTQFLKKGKVIRMSYKRLSGKIRVAVSALAAGVALPALAYWTPVQISLYDVAGLPPAAESVYGLRANVLSGECDSVVGLDVGIHNLVRKDAYGIRAGLFNFAYGNGCGITAGLINSDEFNGGLAAGGFNLMERASGIQIGLINGANTYSGVQVGLVNMVQKNFCGLQIGLLNFYLAHDIPVLPLINFGFDSKK